MVTSPFRYSQAKSMDRNVLGRWLNKEKSDPDKNNFIYRTYSQHTAKDNQCPERACLHRPSLSPSDFHIQMHTPSVIYLNKNYIYNCTVCKHTTNITEPHQRSSGGNTLPVTQVSVPIPWPVLNRQTNGPAPWEAVSIKTSIFIWSIWNFQ